MLSLFLSLSLASTALTLSIPTVPSHSRRQFASPPPKSQESTIFFTRPTGDGTELFAVNAVANGTEPQLVLVGGPTTGGTPAFLNGTSPTAALVFDLSSEHGGDTSFLYGAKVDNLGDAYGASEPVAAYENLQDANWGEKNGTLFHKLFAGAEGFFACADTVNGQAVTILKFGVYTEQDQPPAGCVSTTLKIESNAARGTPAAEQ